MVKSLWVCGAVFVALLARYQSYAARLRRVPV